MLRLLPKKIHHLTRYFLLLGLLSFLAYHLAPGTLFTLIPMGPPIYFAYWLKNAIASTVGPLPASLILNDFVFLLPITLIYFGVFAFQIKQLWNERGIIRTVSLFALLGFLLYVHYRAWNILTAYFVPNA